MVMSWFPGGMWFIVLSMELVWTKYEGGDLRRAFDCYVYATVVRWHCTVSVSVVAQLESINLTVVVKSGIIINLRHVPGSPAVASRHRGAEVVTCGVDSTATLLHILTTNFFVLTTCFDE
ncbi:unnamed protein product [Spodoptera littoralis]|uniref:Secreted protein n=1 Tax=Spodoptera littoralis TaxID=7109 RepID=A0A9P0MYQ1_SPOLI|nr:unnamed protein product [Spodoptera littoralis]CAH1634954.1 unnamed protein product [Spodoptera littoralis]